MVEKMTKPDKIRQLSQEQMNTLEHLLQGKSDRSVAEAVGVARQTVWDWRNNDILFIAELNRQRAELWREAKERLKSLANHALDAVEAQLDSGDPKASLAAARYILQGTRLLGEADLPAGGPTTPEALIMGKLRAEARQELAVKDKQKKSQSSEFDILNFDPFKPTAVESRSDRAEALAKRRLKKALAEAGLS